MKKDATKLKIKRYLEKRSNAGSVSLPLLLDLSKSGDRNKLARLTDAGAIDHVVDDYEEEERELFAVRNPGAVFSPDFKERFKSHREDLEAGMPEWQRGIWAYFPWLSKLVHILPEEDFHAVRTARNKHLIKNHEQDKFYNAVVGIGGLSIGNSIALAIVLKGGAKHIKIADMDRLALSNINRIRSGVTSLGLLKTEMTARQIYELNPYAEVEIFSEGINPDNIDEFFCGKNKLDIFVDELDNMAVKYLIREYAKKYKVPVVMSADNGDNAVVDVERYDTDPNTKFFHGRLGDVTYKELLNLDKMGIGRMITRHIGHENIPARMQESLQEIGKTIVSWPQLGNTALINGSLVAYLIRKIANGEKVIDNRAIFSLDEMLLPDHNTPGEIKKRKEAAEYFKKAFGL